MDNITQARHNFVLAFQYCWNGKEFPIFREISVSERERIHTGYCAIDLLDEALSLYPDFQEARKLRSEIWHAILANDSQNNYDKYLKSKAWAETRKKFFEQVGRQCICGDMATQVHHKSYANIGKENLLKDLVGLCAACHQNVHQPNTNEVKGKDYWDKFKDYVAKNGKQLQLFPDPDLPSFYGIQIDPNTRESVDRFKVNAIWLVAYRSASELQVRLVMRSSTHYRRLKAKKDIIQREFEVDLGELKWKDGKKWIGFTNHSVGDVKHAKTDQEFSWLHDRLVRLRKVFQPHVLEL